MPMRRGGEKALPSHFVRLAIVVALGAFNAACFQPLYGDQKLLAGGDTVRDKLAAIQISEIPGPNGTPQARLAVSLRNALIYDFNGGGSPGTAIYRLDIGPLATGPTSVIVDVSSGRPDAQIETANATFALTEIETKKVVLTGFTSARASYDIPGSEQRFAQQRALRNAEDRAVEILAQNILKRLSSYFVGGT
jgi:LPS-assembly lipoprotein